MDEGADRPGPSQAVPAGGPAARRLAQPLDPGVPAPSYRPSEKDAICARRSLYGLPAHEPVRGLALSGGGIRSATFSLGLLRGLSQGRLLQKIDYLSTVSGGGYTGAFYCGLFTRRGEGSEPVINARPGDDLLGQRDARRAIDYLRQSGRYLTPNGFGDYVYAGALILRNWAALSLIVGAVIVLFELCIDLVRAGASHVRDHPDHHAEWLAGLASAYLAGFAWISPIIAASALAIFFMVVFSWAYWLTMCDVSRLKNDGGGSGSAAKRESLGLLARPPLVGTILLIGGSAAMAFTDLADTLPIPFGRWIGWAFLVPAAGGLLAWAAAYLRKRSRYKPKTPHENAMVEDSVRHRLTSCLAGSAQVTLWTLVLSIVDTLSFLSFAWTASSISFSAPVALGLLPLVRWLVRKMSGFESSQANPEGDRRSQRRKAIAARLLPALVWFMALVMMAAAVIFWGGLGHWLVLDLAGQCTGSGWQGDAGETCTLSVRGGVYLLALPSVLAFVVLVNLTRAFSNLSSLATFYAARLRRAYLGAGNPVRIDAAGSTRKRDPAAAAMEGPLSVSEGDKGDDLGLYEYYRLGGGQGGAPVHLINVTINATVGRGPVTVQRDRHGLNMSISPEGMSYRLSPFDPVVTKPLGHEDAADTQGSTAQQRPGQSLPLSTWIGISGAAFSTGLGGQTSLAKSVLAFMANVRLGYWWNSDRTRVPVLGCYPNLLREMFAMFRGVDQQQWYLSDGGHFENTAAYELVRREVPFIIISDNGCDPDYGFQDLANLTRKCRIDFGARIEFMDSCQLDRIIADPVLRRYFGTPADFAFGKQDAREVALLARIDFMSGRSGTMLVIKPRLSDDGPNDLLRYRFENRNFPQQTTLDQFFDEAQWESYFELGRLVACRLFRTGEGGSWRPADLLPVPQWPDHADRISSCAGQVAELEGKT